MKRVRNEPLYKHTTFRIGGPAELFLIPESEEELLESIRICKEKGMEYRILGRGSNLLVNDKGIKGAVTKNTEACTHLEKDGHFVRVGSSVSLQKFVRFCVENSLEGMEYLYSVPATVGGAIYMNAGRGRKHNLSISDALISVRVFDGDKVMELKKEECGFDYRYSIFHEHKDWIILGAKFELEDQPKEIGEQKIKERMKFVKDSQNRRYPNAGSIFKKKPGFALRIVNGCRIGGAQIKGNWISNIDGASFKDVLWLIRLSRLFSYLSLTKPELEIEIWYR